MRTSVLMSLTLASLVAFVAGCGKPEAPRTPTKFEISSVAARPHPQNTNIWVVTGVASIRDEALKNKILLLRLNSKAAFSISGVTYECNRSEVLITNGSGTFETYYGVQPRDRPLLGPQISSPTLKFEAEGFTELQPASAEAQ